MRAGFLWRRLGGEMGFLLLFLFFSLRRRFNRRKRIRVRIKKKRLSLSVLWIVSRARWSRRFGCCENLRFSSPPSWPLAGPPACWPGAWHRGDRSRREGVPGGSGGWSAVELCGAPGHQIGADGERDLPGQPLCATLANHVAKDISVVQLNGTTYAVDEDVQAGGDRRDGRCAESCESATDPALAAAAAENRA